MSKKLNVHYETTARISSYKRIGAIQNLMYFGLRCLLLAVALCAIPTGCASFSSQMSSQPDRFGPPPYADDPEANGDPEKAWWN